MIALLAIGFAAAAPASWTPSRVVVGGAPSFGMAIAAGDVDCDDWLDLVVASPSASGLEGERQGVVEVRRGAAEGWAAAASWEKWGSVEGRQGEALAAGDLDGDGCADLAVGEPGRRDERGTAILFLGGVAGLRVDPPDFTASGAAPGDVLGTGLVVDDDRDGLGGLLYGAPGWGDDEGLVALHAGPDLTDAPTWVWAGEPGDQLGWSLAWADLQGTGERWLVAGAPGFDSGLGRARLLPPGATEGAAASAEGARHESRFGQRVASLGPVFGDARDALAVCAPGHDAGAGQLTIWTLDGADLVLRQTLDGPAAGAAFCSEVLGGLDLDADGWPDLALSVRGRAETWLYYGDGAGFSGPAVVLDGGGGLASLGDWDADGHADLAVGVVGLGRVDVHLGRPDADHDGVGDTDDCAPLDPDVGAVEVWFRDDDGDGFGVDAQAVETCAPPVEGHSAAGGDCDDAEAGVHPGADEAVGDGVDQDCDGEELCFVDADGDGYRASDAGAAPSADLSCATDGLADAEAPTGDCDDSASSVSPGATDWPDDGRDQDCDGADATMPPPAGAWRSGCATGPAGGPRWGWIATGALLGLRARRRSSRGVAE